MKEDNKVDLMEKKKSIIMLNILNKVLIEMTEEKDSGVLWAKLRSLHLMKSLNNRLYG